MGRREGRGPARRAPPPTRVAAMIRHEHPGGVDAVAHRRPADGLRVFASERDHVRLRLRCGSRIGLNCRLAQRLLCRMRSRSRGRLGAKPPSWCTYPGLRRRSTTSADFEPEPGRAASAGTWTAPASGWCCASRPTWRSIGRFGETSCSTSCSSKLGRRDDCGRWSCQRTPGRAERIRALALPALLVPDDAVDGQSLVAGADLVVSAVGADEPRGGSIGTPVYTTYQPMGGVDERLIAERGLRSLEQKMEPDRRAKARRRRRTPPAERLDLALAGLASA